MLPAQPGPEPQALLHLPHSFDLIFLDANKDGYQSYYNTILDCHLLAPGGLLVVDNTLMKVGLRRGVLAHWLPGMFVHTGQSVRSQRTLFCSQYMSQAVFFKGLSFECHKAS